MMARYFLELSYHGGNYAGFQIQDNAHTVQQEVERALTTYLRSTPVLTGSSRTDSGVHARQNFFHFDIAGEIDPRAIYNLNAILPGDIVIRSLHRVHETAHCRFDAISRRYIYRVYSSKDPFLRDRAYYYPYTLHIDRLYAAAASLVRRADFSSFSKRNTQVHTFNCDIMLSRWTEVNGVLEYEVAANRFLRGMVRGLVATMLRIGRGRLDVEGLDGILAAKDNAKAWFDVPGHGLMLEEVKYDWEEVFNGKKGD
jgi:tRNA pseudouridine38-40 synthase